MNNFLNKYYTQFFLISILVFIVFSPVLIGGQFFFQGDNLNFSFPNLSFYQQSIKDNTNFWWNPYIFSGFPSFLSIGGYLSPFYYFFLHFFNFLSFFHWFIFFNLVFGAFLTTRLLIHFKISAPSALIGGISYILGSIPLITDLSVINYLPFIPAIIWLLIICYEKSTWWPVFVGSLLIYIAWVSIHFNWLLIVFAAGFIFSLFYPWVKKEIDYKKYLILLAKYLTMVIAGSLLAISLLFPLFNYLPYSHRGGGLSYNEATSGSAQILDFINFIFPYSTPPFFATGAQFYFGILPLFFFIFSLALFKKNRLVKLLILIFLFCLLIAVKYSPLFWLMQKLPFLGSFRGPCRWMALGLFAGSILAGIGLDNFLKTDFEKFRFKLTKIFKWLVLFVIAVAIVGNLTDYLFGEQILSQVKNYFDKFLYAKTTGLPIEHYHQVIEQIYISSFDLINLVNLKFLCPLLILAISFLAIYFFGKNKKIQNYFFPAVLFLTALNFLLVMPFSYQTAPRQFFSYQPQIAKKILENPGKIFSFLPGFSEFDRLSIVHKPTPQDIYIFYSEFLVPSTNGFYRIKSADGYNSLMPRRQAEILAMIGSDRAVTGEKLSDLRIPLTDKIKLFRERLNLVNLLGIKYIISAYPIEDDCLENVLTIEATNHKIPLYLYQNKNSLSEIYFANEVSFLALKKDEENYNMIIRSENDFNKMTFIECSNCQKTEKPAFSSIEAIEEKNGYLEAEVTNKNGGWLVFGQSNLPGWQATIDGKNTQIYTANYLFQAIFVPAGNHEIIFKYNPFNLAKFYES